jgi:hypothetical protein
MESEMYSTPCIASCVIDELSAGAVLKHVRNDSLRALVIICGDKCVAVTCDTEELDPGLMFDPVSYEAAFVNLDEWIALTLGGPEELVE